MDPCADDGGHDRFPEFSLQLVRHRAVQAISARVVYVGPRAIVLEDNAGVLAGKIDADLIALATDFEEVSFPLFAELRRPMAYDAQTDGNGRIIMLFTPQVNSAAANVLGFVSSCDFFPATADPQVSASNLAEIFYARTVTDTSPTNTSLNSRVGWKRQMPSHAHSRVEAHHLVRRAVR
jgi:hypothetical protein